MKTTSYIKTIVKFTSVLFILIIGLADFGIKPVWGAEPVSVLAQSGSPVTITGSIAVVWGDGGPDSKVSKGPIYFLTEKNKSPVIIELSQELEKSLGGTPRLLKKQVTVQGNWILPPGQAKKTPILQVEAIQFHQGTELPRAISGPQPWVSILCKFADISNEPNSLPYFQGMYGSTYPGLDHYWRQQSFNIINMNGSSAAGWFT